jgi:serine/threonine protein kinase
VRQPSLSPDSSLNLPSGLAKFSSFEKLNLQGRGASGSVYRCSLPNGKLFALKEILLPTTQTERYVDLLKKEVALVTSLSHPHLTKYYASSVDEETSTARIFMEFIPNGSLGELVRAKPEPMSEALASKYVAQILSGLAYLHGKGVIHRDIKCDNILLANDGSAKISDFGAAKLLDNNSDTLHAAQTMIGTPYFMAPEMLMADYKGDSTGDDTGLLYGKRADIWSLGILTLELLNRGAMPWPPVANVGQLILHISSDGILPIIPSRLSPEATEFVTKCCERDASRRWRAAELLTHPWIEMFNGDNLAAMMSLSENDVDF